MSLLNRLKEKLQVQSKSKFVYEEREMRDGELHITRVTKTGEEADKELAKHYSKLDDKIKEFIRDFFKD